MMDPFFYPFFFTPRRKLFKNSLFCSQPINDLFNVFRYGSRQTSEECPEAIIAMCVQSVLGVIISACMAGIVFAKLARPKNRSHTVMFSKNAVVSMR